MITTIMLTHGLGQDTDNFILFGMDVFQASSSGPFGNVPSQYYFCIQIYEGS